MSQFIFDDIYGNESARDRYEHHREFSYFNTVLRLHNKYYEDNSMHNYIFSPRKGGQKVGPLPAVGRKPKFTYYSVEKINNLTFRINRRSIKRGRSKKQLAISSQQSGGKAELHHAAPKKDGYNELNRDIMKDAQFLKATLREGTRSKLASRYERDGIDRSNRLSVFAVNKELRSFVEHANSTLH